jgi:hypothetical protein
MVHHRQWIRGCREHVTALAGYLLVAIVFTWPLITHLGTHLPGSPDGDTGVYVWNQWVFQHELLDHRTLPYFTSKIFAATGRANLSLHNYTTFANLLALPIVKSLGVVAAFNLVYLALTLVTSYATFLLAKRLTGGDAPVAWLAGLLFAWSPALVTRGMGHFSLVAAAPLPIFVLQLTRLHERPSRREAILLGATVAWATACDVYYGIYCVMMATAYLLSTSFHLTRSRETPSTKTILVLRSIDMVALSIGGLVLALLISNGWQFTFVGRVVQIRTIYTPALLMAGLAGARALLYLRPILRPVSVEQIGATVRAFATAAVVATILMSPLLYAFGVRVMDGQVDGATIFWRSSPPGIDAVAPLVPNPNHPIAHQSVRNWVAGLTRDGYLENVASIPFVALIVMFLAWRAGWRPPTWIVVLTIGFALLALGPFVRIGGVDTHIPAPWAFLRYLPIVRLARSPSRFFIVAMLGVAVLFALALRNLAGNSKQKRSRVILATAAVLFFELCPAPRMLYSAAIPSFYRIVASDPRPDVTVLELPFGIRDGTRALGNYTSRTQFYQTAHAKPIVGGYLSRVSWRRMDQNERDPVIGALIRLSEGKQLSGRQEDALRSGWSAFLQRANVGYVVLDRNRAPDMLRAFVDDTTELDQLANEPPLTLYRPSARD